MPRRKVTPEIVEEMKRLREEGLSYGKIANRLGLNPMTVYNHLRKKGKAWVHREAETKAESEVGTLVETRPIAFVCHDFVNGGGTKEKKTAVVVSIKNEGQGSVLRISWACSRGPTGS